MEHQDVEAHEHRAIEEVRVRLSERFPDVERTEVDRAVDDALAGITGPVRDFVPILVERAAARTLSAASAPTAEVIAASPHATTSSPSDTPPQSTSSASTTGSDDFRNRPSRDRPAAQ